MRLTAEADVEAARDQDVAVIYKHSSRCGVSLAAAAEVRQFMEAEPTVPVYVVDVIRDRPVSAAVERAFGVRHESPQAILLRAGVPVWNASHRDVTRASLSRELATLRPPDAPGV